MKHSAAVLAFFLILPQLGCASEPTTVRAEVWADNWYAIYVGDELVMEDTTPFATERSFNADTKIFEAELPAQLNVILKDYKEDETGLEYIGSRRQQIGDGGFAAQFFDNDSDELIAVSSGEWRCLAIQRAPLNRSCETSSNPEADCGFETTEEPGNWHAADFDDNEWPKAVEHSPSAVRPHGDYSSINWHSDVKLIWSADLEIDNTILCRTDISKR